MKPLLLMLVLKLLASVKVNLAQVTNYSITSSVTLDEDAKLEQCLDEASANLPVPLTGCPEYRNRDPQTLLLKYLREDYANVSPQCYLDLLEAKDAMDIKIAVNMLQLMDVVSF